MKLPRLDGESPFDYIQRVNKAEKEERAERESNAKADMKYGLLRVSARRLAIIRYMGVSRIHMDTPAEYSEIHFQFMPECESMPYNIAVAHLKFLITGGKG